MYHLNLTLQIAQIAQIARSYDIYCNTLQIAQLARPYDISTHHKSHKTRK